VRRDRANEPVKVVTFGVVELEGVTEAVEDAVGDAADVAAFQPRVVLDADACQERYLLAAQSGDAAVRAVHGQPRLLRREPRASGREELAYLVLRVHEGTVAPPNAT